MLKLIEPDWAAPVGVQAAMTTRLGGVSVAPYDSLNLGYATGDDRAAVIANEARVAQALSVAATDIRWVYQVHGTDVHPAESLPANEPFGATTIRGDAIVSHTPGLLCGIKIADCMPVLFAARDGTAVGAAHAGGRGLSGGVLEATLAAMNVNPATVVAWLGPCIGPAAFEVGDDVRTAFVTHDVRAAMHFKPRAAAGKYLCDLYALARQRLAAVGVGEVTGGAYCTYSQPDLFFSHRRHSATGRMAAFVWIDRR